MIFGFNFDRALNERMTFAYCMRMSMISLPAHNLVSPQAGEIWYASSVLWGLLLFGLAVFLFVFGVLPYWFKLHKHLNDILGCAWPFVLSGLLILNEVLIQAGR